MSVVDVVVYIVFGVGVVIVPLVHLFVCILVCVVVIYFGVFGRFVLLL